MNLFLEKPGAPIKVLSLSTFSQIQIHKPYGGVVPEIASRNHLETVNEMIDAALKVASMSGAHATLFPRVIEELRARGRADVLVFGGGVIPVADVPTLKAQGVAEIFTPGASLKAITRWLETTLDARED